MPAIQPWERQQGESEEAFEAFKVYLDMGDARSLRKVAEQLVKSTALIERWSSEKNWVERCRAFDNMMLRREIDQLEKDRVRARRNHANISRMMQSKALEKLRSLDAEKMSTSELVKMVDTAVRIELLALGQPTSRTGGDSGVTLQEKLKARARTAWEESALRYPTIPERRRIELLAEHFGVEPDAFLSWIGAESPPMKALPTGESKRVM